jgi:hypothetical protein
MHVAGQLKADQFQVEVRGVPADRRDVLPSWSALDRLGVVVTEPLGGLGASLLIQLAIACFYDVKPTRRTTTPSYPDVYIFQVGGPHGDFSNFDIWPPRKEVQVPTGQPLALLEEINTHGISRLALPEGPVGDVTRLATGPSLWVEQASAVERLASCFLYSATGNVRNGDVRVSTSDARVAENVEDSLLPLEAAAGQLSALASENPPVLPGLSIAADIERWAAVVRSRADEITAEARGRAAAAWAARREGESINESYRTVTAVEALAHLAGLDLPSNR